MLQSNGVLWKINILLRKYMNPLSLGKAEVDLSSPPAPETRLTDQAVSKLTPPLPSLPPGRHSQVSQATGSCYFILGHAELYFWTYHVTYLTGPIFTEGHESLWSTTKTLSQTRAAKEIIVISQLCCLRRPRFSPVGVLLTRPQVTMTTSSQGGRQSIRLLVHYKENKSPRPWRARYYF